MASTSDSGILGEFSRSSRDVCFPATCGVESEVGTSGLDIAIHQKKRRVSCCVDSSSHQFQGEGEIPLPTLNSPDYFIQPSLAELAARELSEPSYLSRVESFTIGRFGYGYIKFFGETDVRWLDLNKIVKFSGHEVVVYEDESAKPAVGEGLNKPAEVTLILPISLLNCNEGKLDDIIKKLKGSSERQGANFISFNCMNGEWKFLVKHFSRFGLSDDDEEDIIMDDARTIQDPVDADSGEIVGMDEEPEMELDGPELSHSLPAHLGLDPIKMKEMRMLMFPAEQEEIDDFTEILSHQRPSHGKEYGRSSFRNSTQRMSYKSSPPISRKSPLALLEYKPGQVDATSPGSILLAQQNKGIPPKVMKADGFVLDITHETPVTKYHSRNIVDAGLFMGRSFRVGWGPNGILVHTGAPVGSNSSHKVLSSVINLEQVAIDKAVRDENNRVNKELVELAFDSPLNLHKSLNHEVKDVEVGSFKMKLHNLVCDRFMLSEVCRNYADIIERQLELSVLSSSARLVLMHQVMVWELVRVLFSDRENSGQSKSVGADNEEDAMEDVKDGSSEVDPEAFPLIRRAQFSFWLQEYVCHRVQAEVSSLNECSYLKHLFLLLTGRQLDAAVELAASKGDVRLACLISQAGGSMVNRKDISRQLDIWRINDMDFNFIEKDRIKILELLAGNIRGALHDFKIDWKRFLGLLMWYQLPPDTSLPVIFRTYQRLLNDRRAPYPIPVYIDEGPVDETSSLSIEERSDLSYYLMLLHSNQDRELGFLKKMFNALSSTYDPLDYHMIWHHRALLEAIGAFSSNELHVIDMALVSQLLCLGKCHWAIYVLLHMPYHKDYPYLQATAIREILFQYCECWSVDESQQQFIEELGVPSAWLHEAMAIYFSYCRDVPKSMEHYLQCSNWQKAHSIFVTSVSHSLFLSGEHLEIWRLATLMEEHKSEIENWDFGAGIYIAFYSIKSSLKDDGDHMPDLDLAEGKQAACKEFFGQLNNSLAIWGGRLPLHARVAYSKMAEEISTLFIEGISEAPTREIQLSCIDTVCSAPIPGDLRASHLQDAVSIFTSYLSELAS